MDDCHGTVNKSCICYVNYDTALCDLFMRDKQNFTFIMLDRCTLCCSRYRKIECMYTIVVMFSMPCACAPDQWVSALRHLPSSLYGTNMTYLVSYSKFNWYSYKSIFSSLSIFRCLYVQYRRLSKRLPSRCSMFFYILLYILITYVVTINSIAIFSTDIFPTTNNQQKTTTLSQHIAMNRDKIL